MDQPLAGITVLSMEQAAALPFATRHLADLGAEVIRVESHGRARPSALSESDLLRNKRRIGIDLAAEGGPEVFRRLAANVDVVAHNFTPRVMRKYGIDFESVRQVNPDVIYVSITGFGTTGPWGERPLFGPGAEAVSGHNVMIGEPDAWPGRPGTIVYADNNTGLNAAFAVLAALDHRDATGEAVHVDLSLYEAAIAHLGVAVTERAFGAPLPERIGNADRRYPLHGVFAAAGHDRSVAIAAAEADLPSVGRVLGLNVSGDVAGLDAERVAVAVSARPAEEVAAALQAAGVAAHAVADCSDQVQDEHLWARGYFGILPDGGPHAGPAFGGGADVAMTPPHRLGQDNDDVLARPGGFAPEEIEAARAAGAIGEGPAGMEPRRPADYSVRLARAELSRVDETFDGWRRFLS